jgi:pilus assembly protein CpaB
MLLVDLDNDFQTLLPNFNVGVIAPGPVTEQATEKPSIVAVSEGGNSIVGRATQDPLLGQTFYHIPSEEQRPRMVSQNLLQDAIVLQVGSFPSEEEEAAAQQEQGGEEAQPTPEPTGEEEQAAPKVPPPPDVITLIVTPQDAITLNYLVYSGAQLTLALRAAQDDTRVQTESVTLQFLLEQYNITVPAKLPNGMEPPVRALQTPELPNEVQPTPAP